MKLLSKTVISINFAMAIAMCSQVEAADCPKFIEVGKTYVFQFGGGKVEQAKVVDFDTKTCWAKIISGYEYYKVKKEVWVNLNSISVVWID